MEKFYNNIRNFKFPKKHELNSVFSYFSKKEWISFWILAVILVISTIILLQKVNQSFMVSIPMKGGSISEGIVGTPRFVNPILAISDADRDLVSLIYSGLMRKDSDDNLIPDLAEKYDISKDGLIYTFTLKNNIYFQDGKPVTADDIVFTINEVKDKVLKSPKKGNWDGVSVEKVDEKTVKFTLKQPYSSFLENTTLGIMPLHVWGNSIVELNDANTNPIGSGPYQVSKVSKQSSGIIDYYELTQFKKFALGKPYIKNVTLRFYSNENDLVTAFLNNEVDQISSITPEDALILKEKGYRIESSILPRVFGLFFNQNQNQIFTDKVVLKAINEAVDKEKIVQEVLQGYGTTIDSPIPEGIISYLKLSSESGDSTRDEKVQKIQASLAKAGWKTGVDGFLEKNTVAKKKKTTSRLEFSISTGNSAELVKSAEIIQDNLKEIGIKVNVKTFDIGNLNQSVIRPRKYDALLFGQIINHESELFAFWHSSQRKDPGLNVAMYTNTKVDKILEDAYVTIDEKARVKKYAQFEDEIKKDIPAVFLYSPDFIYVVSKNLKGFKMGNIISPSDRFFDSYLWYTKTDNVWKMFSNYQP